MTWNAERLAELRMLESLLHEVASIDRATGAVERIKWCITIATLLTKSDLRVPRTSFINFLQQEAVPVDGEDV